MKLIKKILIVVLIAIGIGVLIALDISDRDIFYSRHTPEEELKEFHFYKTIEEVKEAYERNYENPKYLFPRGNVEKVKIYKNQFLTSRITSKTLSNEEAKSTIDFLNEPDNFDWGETTWSLNESEYILRFFDNQNNEIGKVWLCVEDCGMTESIPFSPNMKFGGLSQKGRANLTTLLKRINEN
jgi:hypothetical protein